MKVNLPYFFLMLMVRINSIRASWGI